MKNVLKVALGILTSVGGFLDVGAIATSVEAGTAFGYQLIWALVLSTICIIFLLEMSGRLAAVSRHTVADIVRERFGFRFFVVPLVAEIIVDAMLLAAEIGGVCLALQLVTGISFHWFALPVGFLVWLLIWGGTFSLIEDGTALLGLVTICFVVAAWKLHPSMRDIAAGAIPSLPQSDPVHYWFVAVSIIGAIITPFLLYFYSSGAVEDKWDETQLATNRGVSTIGMSFGALIAIAVMILAALVLQPQHISIERYEQIPLLLTSVFGKTGFYLFAASLGIACFGACTESTLSLSYVISQAFGWEWGEDLEPKENARFATTYTIVIFAASVVMSFGIDPLKLTMFTMAVTAVILPIIVAPFLIIMNDRKYLHDHTNGWTSNFVVLVTVVIACIIAIVAIPLEVMVG
jgi:Mn2+/Fe2+ NRAMP family transporter